ncbi:hypothetical protein N4T77_18280 [Clostridium sp. CX1]|uniref:hypothetical protein n=1 Tax=Clostridium sp. CX1 TaxID=2978346 RepID=UPI0021C0DEA8|nr:hypothetical protein [Clostridium sp. CX1]MCT8978540.1 hypothetical protein [Clostridium sp. CX1]
MSKIFSGLKRYELYRDLGGVTKELLIDNPKALVISTSPDKEVKLNENALRQYTNRYF